MRRSLIVLPILASLLVIPTTIAIDSSTYVDQNDNFKIEDVAQVVCKSNRGTKNLIGKASTISMLVDYFMEIESNHKLFDCRKKYIGSLAQLAHVVDSFSDDVCGEDKLKLIETYHRKYISRVRKHLREQKRGGRAPEMAKLFFMQYITEISSKCEQSAIMTIASNKHKFNSDDIERVEQLREFTDSLGMTDLSEGYRGIYLFWNMVDALDLARVSKFSNYLDEEASIRVNVQIKDARPIKTVQTMCSRQLKPVYSRSLLPILRLIDMGYYPRGNELADNFNSDPATRSLFFLSQICETLLPIEVFSDEQLAEDQFVALTKDEASQMTPIQMPQDKVDESIELSPKVEALPVSLEASKLSFDITLVEEVKANVEHRGSIINRLLKHLAKNIKNQPRTTLSGFKLFAVGQDEQLKPVDEEESLKQVDPEQALQIDEDESEDSEDGEGLVRAKRWLLVLSLAPLMFPLAIVAYQLVYKSILLCLKTAFLIIPTLILLPWFFAGNDVIHGIVVRAWLWGINSLAMRDVIH